MSTQYEEEKSERYPNQHQTLRERYNILQYKYSTVYFIRLTFFRPESKKFDARI